MHASSTPDLQRAALIHNPGKDGSVVLRNDVRIGEPAADEVLIKLTHSGICGSELRALRGWGKYDQIVGHEGVGNVAQLNTGRSCPGTLQQYVVAKSRHITHIPDGVPSEIAATLLCAGLTMMGALAELSKDVSKGDWVVILGSGGGLGHLGVQIATKIFGFKVIAVDSGEKKRLLSLESGASLFIDYMTQDVVSEVRTLVADGIAGVVVVPSSREAFRVSPHLARPMGTILCVGLPSEETELPIPIMLCIRKALTIKGILVGTDEHMTQLLQYAAEGLIVPRIKLVDFSVVPNAMGRLKNGEIVGRLVAAIPP